MEEPNYHVDCIASPLLLRHNFRVHQLTFALQTIAWEKAVLLKRQSTWLQCPRASHSFSLLHSSWSASSSVSYIDFFLLPLCPPSTVARTCCWKQSHVGTAERVAHIIIGALPEPSFQQWCFCQCVTSQFRATDGSTGRAKLSCRSDKEFMFDTTDLDIHSIFKSPEVCHVWVSEI